MSVEDYRGQLKEKGLKITPQRLAVLEAVSILHDHPTADEVGRFIREKYPDIATGTIYNALDTLVENELLCRVKTERGLMRYDAITASHHHLYSAVSDRIEDYFDDELTRILNNYFEKKKIPDFTMLDYKLQITGRFRGEK